MQNQHQQPNIHHRRQNQQQQRQMQQRQRQVRIALSREEEELFDLLRTATVESGMRPTLRVVGGWVRDKIIESGYGGGGRGRNALRDRRDGFVALVVVPHVVVVGDVARRHRHRHKRSLWGGICRSHQGGGSMPRRMR